MWGALKLWAGELVASYLIGRAWLELVDLTAKHVRKQPPTLEIKVTAEDSQETECSAT